MAESLGSRIIPFRELKTDQKALAVKLFREKHPHKAEILQSVKWDFAKNAPVEFTFVPEVGNSIVSETLDYTPEEFKRIEQISNEIEGNKRVFDPKKIVEKDRICLFRKEKGGQIIQIKESELLKLQKKQNLHLIYSVENVNSISKRRPIWVSEEEYLIRKKEQADARRENHKIWNKNNPKSHHADNEKQKRKAERLKKDPYAFYSKSQKKVVALKTIYDEIMKEDSNDSRILELMGISTDDLDEMYDNVRIINNLGENLSQGLSDDEKDVRDDIDPVFEEGLNVRKIFEIFTSIKNDIPLFKNLIKEYEKRYGKDAGKQIKKIFDEYTGKYSIAFDAKSYSSLKKERMKNLLTEQMNLVSAKANNIINNIDKKYFVKTKSKLTPSSKDYFSAVTQNLNLYIKKAQQRVQKENEGFDLMVAEAQQKRTATISTVNIIRTSLSDIFNINRHQKNSTQVSFTVNKKNNNLSVIPNFDVEEYPVEAWIYEGTLIPTNISLEKTMKNGTDYGCYLAAMYFYTLVSNTPFDEDYTQSYEINVNRVPSVYNQNGSYKSGEQYLSEMKQKKEIRIKHKSDDMHVRGDWILEYHGLTFKAFKTAQSNDYITNDSYSGSAIEFEESDFINPITQLPEPVERTKKGFIKNINMLPYVRNLYNKIYSAVITADPNYATATQGDFDINVRNVNPLWTVLEYGGYTGGHAKGPAIGSKYGLPHGSKDSGFTYQAPLGFKRIVDAQYNAIISSAKTTPTTKRYTNSRRSAKFNFDITKLDTEEYSGLVDILREQDHTIGTAFISNGMLWKWEPAK